MVNESILGGLRTAIEHKSSLKQAMQSFYNAGYNKEEIEEAAKIIFQEQQNMPQQKPVQNSNQTQENTKKKSPKKTGLIIALIALVIILIGGLVILFIFKDKIF